MVQLKFAHFYFVAGLLYHMACTVNLGLTNPPLHKSRHPQLYNAIVTLVTVILEYFPLAVCNNKQNPLTGGVFIVSSLVSLSVKPGSNELPPTAIIPLYRLYRKTITTAE